MVYPATSNPPPTNVSEYVWSGREINGVHKEVNVGLVTFTWMDNVFERGCWEGGMGIRDERFVWM